MRFFRPERYGPVAWERRKFCSVGCSSKRLGKDHHNFGKGNPRLTKACANCGNLFKQYPHVGRAQFSKIICCSRTCAGALRKRKTLERRPLKVCKTCGKQFTSKNLKYCSPECFLKQRKRPARNCLTCGRLYHPTTEGRKYCSNKCAQLAPRPRGESNPCWKGRSVTGGGYVLVRVPDDSPFAAMRTKTGYVLEHRLVLAKSLHRVLEKHEEVHHINGERHDNRLKNLQLRNVKHGSGAAFQCCDCGSINVKPITV